MQRRTEHDVKVDPVPTRSPAWRGHVPRSEQAQSQIPRPPAPPRLIDRRKRSDVTVNWIGATPSWLMSLILHLGCMLMMASLVVPLSRHSRLDRLFVTFGDARDAELAQAPVTVTVPQALDEQADPEPMAATAPPVEAAEWSAKSASAAALDLTRFDWSAITDLARRRKRNQNPDQQPRASFVRIEPVARVNSSATDPQVPRYAPDENDAIVAAFIEFDVGRLSGDAGRVANRRFQALGAQAIPALVRGLNRSATIHASCPVGVISRKLERLMQSTDDAGLIEYALSNLGKDVPRAAPHRSRVISFRDQIENAIGRTRERIVRGLEERGWDVDNQTADQISRLMVASEADLTGMLESTDANERATAAMAIALSGDRLGPRERSRLGLALADALDLETDALRQELVQQACAALASRPADFQLTPQEWREYWGHQKRVYLVSSLTTPRLVRQMQTGDPATRLAIMDVLSKSDRQPISDTQRYEMAMTIVREFDSFSAPSRQVAEGALIRLAKGRNPGQGSVDRWRKFWNAEYFEKTVIPRSEAHLQQARFLEQRGKYRAAIERYETVIRRFPRTPAAKQAQQRRDAIIQRSRS